MLLVNEAPGFTVRVMKISNSKQNGGLDGHRRHGHPVEDWMKQPWEHPLPTGCCNSNNTLYPKLHLSVSLVFSFPASHTHIVLVQCVHVSDTHVSYLMCLTTLSLTLLHAVYTIVKFCSSNQKYVPTTARDDVRLQSWSYVYKDKVILETLLLVTRLHK